MWISPRAAVLKLTGQVTTGPTIVDGIEITGGKFVMVDPPEVEWEASRPVIVDYGVPAVRTQPRNSLCVCGSGKKAKKCCVVFPAS